MHVHHTALPVSVPGRLQFIETCLKRLSVHHVLIVGVRLFDGFVNRTEIKNIEFRTVESTNNKVIEWTPLRYHELEDEFSQTGLCSRCSLKIRSKNYVKFTLANSIVLSTSN